MATLLKTIYCWSDGYKYEACPKFELKDGDVTLVDVKNIVTRCLKFLDQDRDPIYAIVLNEQDEKFPFKKKEKKIISVFGLNI